MDHPLREKDQKALRHRVVQLLREAYKARRSSNIVFVCGGTQDADMRMLFRDYCKEKLSDFEIFLPEYAMDNVFSTAPDDPFDITDFEKLISELSHAIVVFPEAAGSFAETGYFSAIEPIARRCILVLNSKYQNTDSFISLGPAKKIGAETIFHPLMQIDYENPDFDAIISRIRKRNDKKYKKHLSFEKFGDLGTYEICCLIHKIVDIFTIATIDDIIFSFTFVFKNRYSKNRVRQLVSILLGAQYLKSVGEYGHMAINSVKPPLLELREGYIEQEKALRLSLADLYQDCEPDFLSLVEASRNVD